MAESNATQVILTDDGIKIIKAQNTADNAASGVTNLNDPNLMSVIEKQNNIGQFAGLTSQYNVLVQNAKDDGIDTTAVAKAYNNLNKFMADILVDPNHASDINRVTYKEYQDAYNEELSKLQNALQNNANNKLSSAASATSQAASTASQAFSAADNAFSQAQLIGSQADSEIAVQSEATVKAQSTADNAFNKAQEIGNQADSQIASQASAVSEVSKTASEASSRANSALDKADGANAEIIRLKGGSTATIAKLEDGLGTKVDNGDFSTYKTQTASQFSETVKEADFTTYKTQTAGLIEAKVDNGTYQSDKTQTASDIASKVSFDDFSTYKTQTANLINDKVSNSDYASDREQTASEIADRVSNSAFSTYQIQTASQIASKVESSDFNTYKTQTANLISSKVDNGDFTTYKTQTAGLIEAKVDNGTYQSDKTQTASDIASKVADKDFETYKSQTADLISSKVATKDFNTYVSQTATAISSKVESSDFNTYKTQTANLINDKVSSAKYTSDKTQTDNAILSKVSKKDANNVNLISYSAVPKADNLRWVETGGGGTLSATTHAFYHNGADSLYELNTAGSNEVFALSPRFKINANTTYTFQLKGFASYNVSSMDVFVLGRKNGETQDYTVANQIIAGAKLSNSGLDYRTVTFTTGAIDEAYIRIDNNGSTDGKVAILGFTELKLEPGDTATPYVYGSQDSMISQMSDDILFRVTKDDLVDEINLQAGNTLISSSGQLTLSGKSVFIDSVDPVIMKSANIDRILVGKKLTAADISANTFTTNNGTFTVKQDGSVTAKSMTLIGGTLSSPTINTSTINGSTINGTTFNGGDRINNANNTAGYYPMTITPDGAYRSTYFDSAVGLQSSVESGAISYKYRSMIGSGQYSAYDSVINGQGFQSQSGYTSAKDTTFSNPETITGYVNVTPATGIYLYGPTQQINFAGRSDNIGSNGVTMDAYGNMYGQSNSAWWRIGDVNGNQIINFGIDKAGSNAIQFKRELDVGNIGINMAHSIISQDGKGLYINSGRGGRADLNVASLNYTGSVSKSLLSEKRDVKKVNTAYWAQLVNSIDLATYQYKDDDNTSNLRLSGIVDDVNDTKQWQLPDVFVARDEDGKLAGIENVVLQNAMLATIQEQQKEIDKLNGHLLKLEAKLNG